MLICYGLASCASVDSLGVATLEEQKALISDAATTSPNLQPGEKIKVTVFGEDRGGRASRLRSLSHAPLRTARQP